MSDDQQRRRPGRPRTFDRERALTLVVDNYWREGAHSLSLNEVCRRASISKPALYREFGGEDGLMEAALEQYAQLVIQPVLDAIAMPLPFADLMERLIVGMTASGDSPAGCLFTEMRLSRPRLGAATAARIEQLEAQRRGAFEDWYRRALALGEASVAVEPSLAAEYIDAQIASVLMQMGAGASPERVREQARLAFRVLFSPRT
jgi:AcrR family transcriptional regulator